MDTKNFQPNESFFTEASMDLNQKIKILNSWKTTVSQHPDSVFPIPDGFWWKMEEAIRERIQGSVSPSKPVFQIRLAWVLGTVILLLMASVLWLTLPEKLSESNDYLSLINQSNEPEMMAYLGDTDWTDWDVQTDARVEDFEIQISIDAQDLETDLEENFDQWMN